MTKADIIERVHEQVKNLSKKQAAEYVEATFNLMKQTLVNGETVKLSGFGSFVIRQKKARVGRNPVTGGLMTIAQRRVVTFKVSPALRAQVNEK